MEFIQNIAANGMVEMGRMSFFFFEKRKTMWHSAECVFAGLISCYCSRTTKVYFKTPKVSERPGALYYMFESSFLTKLLFSLEFCPILHLRFVSSSLSFLLSFSLNDIQIESDNHCHGFHSKTELPGFYGL